MIDDCVGKPVSSEDCIVGDGTSYRGTTRITEKGLTCLDWEGTFNLPYHNYCRNPDNSSRPWCYTKVTDDNAEWEYCNIGQCQYLGIPDSIDVASIGTCLTLDCNGLETYRLIEETHNKHPIYRAFRADFEKPDMKWRMDISVSANG